MLIPEANISKEICNIYDVIQTTFDVHMLTYSAIVLPATTTSTTIILPYAGAIIVEACCIQVIITEYISKNPSSLNPLCHL
jgi:hypothetical protein